MCQAIVVLPDNTHKNLKIAFRFYIIFQKSVVSPSEYPLSNMYAMPQNDTVVWLVPFLPDFGPSMQMPILTEPVLTKPVFYD